MLSLVLYVAVAQPKISRDPWLWPFASTSIWNMPIGSKASYVPAELTTAPHVGFDIERMIRTVATDPVQTIYPPSAWNKRWPGDRTKPLGSMPVPNDFLLADAQGNDTPNACTTFLMADGRTIKQLEPTCRLEKGGPIVGWPREDQDLYGPGILGTHWGSGLSAIGGSLRVGELSGPNPIRHALKLNIWGKQLYYGADIKGFRWPADRCDNYAEKSCQGKNSKLVMGTLLALPPSLSPAKIGIKSTIGQKLFHAFQDYGAYVSDDSGWDDYDLCAEVGVPQEVENAYGKEHSSDENPLHRDLIKIITSLCIVDNNGPQSIGGGGKPRRPLAPPIAK